MKKIGVICLAMVLALGALGVGYAMWSETLYSETTIETGEVCMELWGPGEVQPVVNLKSCDWNWTAFNYNEQAYSCPEYHSFTHEAACKDIGAVTVLVLSDSDGDGCDDTLTCTVNNTYPYYLAEISVQLKNCGTIPVIIQTPTITQSSDDIMVEWLNHIGWQFEPNENHEVSFFVGVNQTAEQNDSYTFDITFTANQWNE